MRSAASLNIDRRIAIFPWLAGGRLMTGRSVINMLVTKDEVPKASEQQISADYRDSRDDRDRGSVAGERFSAERKRR
jgi:hypothetical protein